MSNTLLGFGKRPDVSNKFVLLHWISCLATKHCKLQDVNVTHLLGSICYCTTNHRGCTVQAVCKLNTVCYTGHIAVLDMIFSN